MKKLTINALLIFAMMIFITGCTTKGAMYSPNLESVSKLQEQELKKVRIEHAKNTPIIYEIPLGRGTNQMSSPYVTYQAYLEKALSTNLELAGLSSDQSNIHIKAILIENELDTGMAVGSAKLSANFQIISNDQMVFNETLGIKHEWESHFVGAVAMPRTVDNYVSAMQKLIDQFLLNKDVLKLLKKQPN